MPELRARRWDLRKQGERFAVNMVIQGTAADIMKVAMVNCVRALGEAGVQSRLILQIHDDLLFEGPGDEAEQVPSSSSVRPLSQVPPGHACAFKEPHAAHVPAVMAPELHWHWRPVPEQKANTSDSSGGQQAEPTVAPHVPHVCVASLQAPVRATSYPFG